MYFLNDNNIIIEVAYSNELHKYMKINLKMGIENYKINKIIEIKMNIFINILYNCIESPLSYNFISKRKNFIIRYKILELLFDTQEFQLEFIIYNYISHLYNFKNNIFKVKNIFEKKLITIN